MLGNLSDEWLKSSDNKKERTPFDIIRHFIHGEKTDWIPRSRIILEQGENLESETFDRFAQFAKPYDLYF